MTQSVEDVFCDKVDLSLIVKDLKIFVDVVDVRICLIGVSIGLNMEQQVSCPYMDFR